MVGNRILLFVLCILNKFKDILVDMFLDVRWPEKSKLADKRSKPKAGGKSTFFEPIAHGQTWFNQRLADFTLIELQNACHVVSGINQEYCL